MSESESGLKILGVAILAVVVLFATLAFGIAVGADQESDCPISNSLELTPCEDFARNEVCTDGNLDEAGAVDVTDPSQLQTLKNWCYASTLVTCEKNLFKVLHPGIVLDMPVW